MKHFSFEFTFAQRDSTIRSNGRNGTAQTHGIAATVYADRGVDNKEGPLVDVITLFPVTSYGEWQNCHIDMPVNDFLKLADIVRERIKQGDLDEIPSSQSSRQDTAQPTG